jgi:hypothetical protein
MQASNDAQCMLTPLLRQGLAGKWRSSRPPKASWEWMMSPGHALGVPEAGREKVDAHLFSITLRSSGSFRLAFIGREGRPESGLRRGRKNFK